MRKILLVTTAILLMIPLTSYSQESGGSYWGWGPRLGLTVNPDQFHFGAHVDFGNLANRLRFQPNFELGFGDNLTLGAANFEVNYRFGEKWDVWTPYLGGGVGILFLNYDNNGLADGSDTDFGASVLGGIEKGISGGDRFFMEAKLGLVDAPDLKLTVGWTFGH